MKTENQLNINDMLKMIMERFDASDHRVAHLDGFIAEQRTFNIKMDERTANLETWRNSYAQ